MSDRDRMDRIERKLNRIGRYVLFGVALFSVLLAMEIDRLSTELHLDYGGLAAWALVGIVAIVVLIARAPFRD